MDPVKKRRAAMRRLAALDVPRLAREPLLYRLCWRLRWELPPPHFGRFVVNVLMATPPCAALAGAAFTALTIVSNQFDADGVPAASMAVGLYLGIAMACYYRYSRWELGQPAWQAFEPSEAELVDESVNDAAPPGPPAPAPRRAAPAPAGSRRPPRP